MTYLRRIKQSVPWRLQKAVLQARCSFAFWKLSFEVPLGMHQYISSSTKKMGGNFERNCPICRYVGYFRAFGHPPRYDAKCPSCGSLERHRLLYLRFIQNGSFAGNKSILHFAPEPIIAKMLKSEVTNYQTADISGDNVDIRLNIEDIDMPSDSVDAILCNHVLEHVNDAKALSEMLRILKPGGKLYTMIPIAEGWDESYENHNIKDDRGRELHFGQHDHVRYFGRDFRDRIKSAGFELEEVTSTGEECAKFSLLRGEKVFVATKR